MARQAGAARPTAPVVAGYRVDDLVGFGGCGEVWRAREILTGRLVALKCLRQDGPPVERDRLRREAALLAGLASPHIVRLLTVVTSATGLVLVLEFQGGGSLASMLRARARIEPGEVVTIAAPLAGALADVHAAGLLHGDVSPANVLFSADGRPVLSDLGVSRLTGLDGADAVTVCYADPAVLAGAPLTPASDVYALAAVCHEALTGQPPFPGRDGDQILLAAREPRPSLAGLVPGAPAALVSALEAALSGDPAWRPDAATFAAQLLAACPALPVRLTGSSVPSAAVPTAAVRRLPVAPAALEPTPSRVERLAAVAARVRISPRRLVALAAVPTAVAAAIWGGVAWARSSSAGARPAAWDALTKPVVVPVPRAVVPAAPTPADTTATTPVATGPAVLPARAAATTQPDWESVITALDTRRDGAFVAGDVSLLTQVYAAGSAPLAADRARLTAMVTAGERASGLALRVQTVEVLAASPTLARLRVSDELAPYALVGSDGRLLQRLPARPMTTWAITLSRAAASSDGWRIAAITRA